jgi:hypothetical protein
LTRTVTADSGEDGNDDGGEETAHGEDGNDDGTEDGNNDGGEDGNVDCVRDSKMVGEDGQRKAGPGISTLKPS